MVGRKDERARLKALLDAAREGRSGALLLYGPPGIGKTELLRYAIEQAADFQLLRARGMESESDIPFAGLAERPVPPSATNDRRCRFEDGVRIAAEDDDSIRYSPAGLIASCPVAAALALWERDVVQPAARRHFGEPVTGIDHAGSFSCRRIYGRSEGRFSEHATADAVDILGFRLADGTSVSVLRDWKGANSKSAFLREVRAGACDLFATVLSPDYNAAHADHFHLDQANRAMGWRLCR